MDKFVESLVPFLSYEIPLGVVIIKVSCLFILFKEFYKIMERKFESSIKKEILRYDKLNEDYKELQKKYFKTIRS